MRVEGFLRGSASQTAGKLALVTASKRMSYADLDMASDRLAASLAENGIARGDRVIVFMENGWEAVVSIFAILKAGAIFSPINFSTKPDKLSFVLRNCQARAVITQTKLAAVVAEAIADSPSVAFSILAGKASPALPKAISFADCLATEAPLPDHHGIDVDLAMLVYTSGSTGRPKGVMMTHRNIEAAATSITTYVENRSDDIILNVLPLAFDYGLYQMLMAVKLGSTLVLEKSFAFPQAIFDLMRKEKVTGLPLVPTMAAMILQMKDLAPGSFPALRYITNTAAALPPAHIARLRELFPRRAALFDVWPHRVQALHLFAARAPRPPARFGRHRDPQHASLCRR